MKRPGLYAPIAAIAITPWPFIFQSIGIGAQMWGLFAQLAAAAAIYLLRQKIW